MKLLLDYYRCPEDQVSLDAEIAFSRADGFFQCGSDIIGYDNHAEGRPNVAHGESLHDALEAIARAANVTLLPFDPAQVVDSLRFERYVDGKSHDLQSLTSHVYYAFRSFLPMSVRKRLQRIRLRHWPELRFPNWPVDRTVDKICDRLLLLCLRSKSVERIPFIWFWPEGAPSCAIMTHDVETKTGRDYCQSLMDIDESFGIPSSFQIVPEGRYPVPASFLAGIRDRGFEINVHDLNHDGFLYRSHNEFLRRVEQINSYGQKFGALGFRSAALYRRQEWYGALRFEYDMSVPSVGHLDAQRGGCCTVMPYFVGNILELPVTATQDYSLFHILNAYSLDLWRQQIDLVNEQHGLISFIVHPDYVLGGRAQNAYKELLSLLAHQRDAKHVWIAKPAEVNRWWRERSRMTLVREGEHWRIEGEGKERARIAYASNENGKLSIALAPRPVSLSY
jgi:hypothetical protein